MSPTPALTSTTAPGKTFTSRQELADHYKSDWHKYNLKRREAGLPVLLEADFTARWQAAMALKQEKEHGTSHLKNNAGSKKKQHKLKKNGNGSVSQVQAYDRIKEAQQEQQEADNEEKMEDSASEDVTRDGPSAQQLAEEAKIEIDPRQCLFDKHVSQSVEANVERMYYKYGFFVPDREYIVDLEGMVGYLHEKIKLGHYCLYCHKMFSTWRGCQTHMIQTRHTKLRYEAGYDLEDLSLFYDFSQADAEFLTRLRAYKTAVGIENETPDDNDDTEEDGWEDLSDAEDLAEDDDAMQVDDEDYDGYEEEIAGMGFDVTPLGELIFPDGRIVGHRSLRRYYKQRPRMERDSDAVSAARIANGERLYQGRVYNIHTSAHTNAADQCALALKHAGIAPGLAAGRAGKGILVSNGNGTLNQLSVYRYRAAIRKQRRENDKGKRVWEKSRMNMNQMDKKANNKMNGVSVAHAPR